MSAMYSEIAANRTINAFDDTRGPDIALRIMPERPV